MHVASAWAEFLRAPADEPLPLPLFAYLARARATDSRTRSKDSGFGLLLQESSALLGGTSCGVAHESLCYVIGPGRRRPSPPDEQRQPLLPTIFFLIAPGSDMDRYVQRTRCDDFGSRLQSSRVVAAFPTSLDLPIQSLILNDLARSLASSSSSPNAAASSNGSVSSSVATATDALVDRVQTAADDAAEDLEEDEMLSMVRPTLRFDLPLLCASS